MLYDFWSNIWALSALWLSFPPQEQAEEQVKG